MIITSILENDLHRSKEDGPQPLMVEIPTTRKFVPCVISTAHGQFVIARKLFEHNGKLYSRIGIFDFDQSKADLLVGDMFDAAYKLSVEMGWNNVIKNDGPVVGREDIKRGFHHVMRAAGVMAQPSVCLIPENLKKDTIEDLFDDGTLIKDNLGVYKYHKYCRLVKSNVTNVVFLSRPDFVGMYTHFLSGGVGFLLHNIELGMSFIRL